MDCTEARDLLDAYADNELGLADAARLNRHLHGCAACRAELAALQALSRTLRAEVPYFPAPAALRQRVLAALPAAAAPAATPSPARRRVAGWGVQAWASIGTSVVAAGILVLATALWLQRPAATGNTLAPQIVASHVRALLSGHPIDVISSDEHTVKPWFNGRLDYAPPVVDLAAQRFPLTGGRVDYVGGRRVAVLTYHAGGHPIALYLFPAAGHAQPPETQSDEGYTLEDWTAGGMRYWAITDAEPAVLQRFVKALRATER